MITFPKDFKEFIQLLHSKKIEYLVIGGYAVGLYGHPRATGDMDIWVAIHVNNALKLVEVLHEFGFASQEIKKDLFLKKAQIIRMGVPPLRLEIVTSIDGVLFEDCYRNKNTVLIENTEVDFISYEDLIKNKKASKRHKDLDDIDHLEKINET